MRFHGTMAINHKGHLEIGGCDTVDLVRNFGTPLIVLDEMLIRETCRKFYRSFVEKYGHAQVIYANKAFSAPALCRIINEEKLGLDVVSGGELYTALQADFPPEHIYFHGNNKSPAEIRMSLEAGVARIVVDNFHEMNLVNEISASLGKKADILLRITPGIEAHSHEYIKTGQIDSKFGFTLPNGQALEAVVKTLDCSHLRFKGLHCHIGSQVFELESYVHTVQVMFDFMDLIRRKTGLVCEELNLGGGFGIYYTEEDRPASIETYADTVMEAVREEARNREYPLPLVIVEPGRAIIGPAGTTLYTIGATKDIPGVRKYVSTDGGMADNIRPALYQAKYEAALANKIAEAPEEKVSITGKCCESGDMLIWDIMLPKVEAGDILAVSCTGAYSYAMSSNYNSLGRPEVILVQNGMADVIIRRESYEDMLRNHVIPKRLKKEAGLDLVSIL
ncbi:MAG: diaminopimelate decarboxylase [Bacillota bacterium]